MRAVTTELPNAPNSANEHGAWDKSAHLRVAVFFSATQLLLCVVLVRAVAHFRENQQRFGFRSRKTSLSVAACIAALCFSVSHVWSVWCDAFDLWTAHSFASALNLVCFSLFASGGLLAASELLLTRAWLAFFEAHLAVARGDSAWIHLVTRPIGLQQSALDRALSSFVRHSRRRSKSKSATLTQFVERHSSRKRQTQASSSNSSQSRSRMPKPKLADYSTDTFTGRMRRRTISSAMDADGNVLSVMRKKSSTGTFPVFTRTGSRPLFWKRSTSLSLRDAFTLQLRRDSMPSLLTNDERTPKPAVGSRMSVSASASTRPNSMDSISEEPCDLLHPIAEEKLDSAMAEDKENEDAEFESVEKREYENSGDDLEEDWSLSHATDDGSVDSAEKSTSKKKKKKVTFVLSALKSKSKSPATVELPQFAGTSAIEPLPKTPEPAAVNDEMTVKVTSEYLWYFEHKTDFGNASYLLPRVTLLICTLWLATCVCLLLAEYLLLACIMWLHFAVLSAAICYLSLRYPRFHDGLQIFEELRLLAIFGVLSIATLLCFLLLRVIQQKKVGDHFWFYFWRSAVLSLLTACFILLQTSVVSYLFEEAESTQRHKGEDKEQSEEKLCNCGSLCFSHFRIGCAKIYGALQSCHRNCCCQTQADSQLDIEFGANATSNASGNDPNGSGLQLADSPIIGSAAAIAVATNGAMADCPRGSSLKAIQPSGSLRRILVQLNVVPMRYSIGETLRGKTSREVLLLILNHDKMFRLFMKHLFNDVAYECLIAVFEMKQFRSALLCNANYEVDFEMGEDKVSKLQRIASADAFYAKLCFPHSIMSEVQSSIVFAAKLTFEQKFLGLVDKYVAETGEMCINVSYVCRRSLLELADLIVDDITSFCCGDIPQPKMRVRHTVFDEAMRQLIGLMISSLPRFKKTPQFDRLLSDFIE